MEHVPVDDYTLDLEKADILVPGTDVTLLGESEGASACESADEKFIFSLLVVNVPTFQILNFCKFACCCRIRH